MSTNTTNTKQIIDTRFNSYPSNCPSVTERFSNELLKHRDEMNKLKSKSYSAAQKVEAFKRAYGKMDTTKFYSISTDSLVKILSHELNSAPKLSA